MKIRAHFADLIDLLTPPVNTSADRLRAQVALAALQISTLSDPDLDPDGDESQRRADALTIAMDIVRPAP
jgi:hypothetical protein